MKRSKADQLKIKETTATLVDQFCEWQLGISRETLTWVLCNHPAWQRSKGELRCPFHIKPTPEAIDGAGGRNFHFRHSTVPTLSTAQHIRA
jgi:hypothetical protein